MTILFKNVRLLEGEGLSSPKSVLIANGKIQDVHDYLPDEASDAEVINGQGQTLLPGLIDAHVHIASRKDLDALAAQGVTSAVDMASWPAELTAQMRAEKGTTQIISAGVPFIGPAGPHSHFGMPDYATITDPSTAEAGVARRIKDGSDFIKIVTEPEGGGGPTPEAVKAVVDAAHAAGKLVVSHAPHHESFRMSVDAGANIITHAPRIQAIDAELAKRTKMAIPTLASSEFLVKVAAGQHSGTNFQASMDTVKALRAAGTIIAAGTDSIAGQPGVPFTIEFGTALHRELELEVEAGFTPAEALRSTTSVPGQLFPELQDRGEIKVGLRADLLLIEGDPTKDITATRNIKGVWIAGKKIK